MDTWELMKYDIRRAALKKGKFIANWKKQKEIEIIRAILNLQTKNCNDLTNEETMNLNKLQSQLENIYEEKNRSAFIRSRCKWLEKR